MQKRSFYTTDEITTLPKTKVEKVTIGDSTILRNTFDVGWKWSKHVKPAAGTKSCQGHHLLCIVSGRLKVVLDDGDEIEAGPGDVVDIPAGHDGWVVGDVPVVAIDVAGVKQNN